MAADSLFSLELYIQEVKDLLVTCFVPGIAFRLLDFPTLIVYSLSAEQFSKLFAKLGRFAVDPQTLDELRSLKEQHGGFVFKRGKSCLFKKSLSELTGLLSKVPLYVMLIESWSERAKLVASCSVPLLSLIQTINKSANALGVDYPAVAESAGSYKLFDLMGTSVGTVSLKCKLTSFGATLLKHVSTGTSAAPPVDILLNIKPGVEHAKILDGMREGDELLTELLPADGVSFGADKLVEDHVEVDLARPVSHHKLSDDVTQTSRVAGVERFGADASDTESEDETPNCNIMCPPPLYLNARTSTRDEAPQVVLGAGQPSRRWRGGVRSDFSQEEPSGVPPLREVLRPVPGQRGIYQTESLVAAHACTQTENQMRSPVEAESAKLNIGSASRIADLAGLPALFAVLQDISKLASVATAVDASNQVMAGNGPGVREASSSIPDFKARTDASPSPCGSHFRSHVRMDQLVRYDHRHRSGVRKENRKAAGVGLISKQAGKTFPGKNSSGRSMRRGLRFGVTKSHNLRYRLTHSGEAVSENVGGTDVTSPSTVATGYDVKRRPLQEGVGLLRLTQETQTEVEAVALTTSLQVIRPGRSNVESAEVEQERSGVDSQRSNVSRQSDASRRSNLSRKTDALHGSDDGFRRCDVLEQLHASQKRALPFQLDVSGKSDVSQRSDMTRRSYVSRRSDVSVSDRHQELSSLPGTSSVTLSTAGHSATLTTLPTALPYVSGSSSNRSKISSTRQRAGALQNRSAASEKGTSSGTSLSTSLRPDISLPRKSHSYGSLSKSPPISDGTHSEPVFRPSSKGEETNERYDQGSHHAAESALASVSLDHDSYLPNLSKSPTSLQTSASLGSPFSSKSASRNSANSAVKGISERDPSAATSLEDAASLSKSLSQSSAGPSLVIDDQEKAAGHDVSLIRGLADAERTGTASSRKWSINTSDVSSYRPSSGVSFVAGPLGQYSEVSSYRNSPEAASQNEDMTNFDSFQSSPFPREHRVDANPRFDLRPYADDAGKSEKSSRSASLVAQPVRSDKSPMESRKFSKSKSGIGLEVPN